MSKFYTGTGVTARWLRALRILPEDPGLVPSTHMAALNHLTPVLGDLMPSSGLQGNCMHMVHRNTYRQNTDTHKLIQLIDSFILSKTVLRVKKSLSFRTLRIRLDVEAIMYITMLLSVHRLRPAISQLHFWETI